MSDVPSLVNLGDLTKPATVLIEKIADATGAIFLPYQLKRIAKAEVEVEKIKAIGNFEITELQQRGMIRQIQEAGKQQKNIEDVTAQSFKDLKEDANPEAIEDDWLSKFFNECKLVSDREMQSLWAKLLAGEANQPGTFSKRTIEFVSNLDKTDALLFTSLCSFGWFAGEIFPLIYDIDHEIYKKNNINFTALTNLDAIGLIRLEPTTGFVSKLGRKNVRMLYYGEPIDIEFQQAENATLHLGKVILTKIGKELAPICGPVKHDDFIDYIVGQWQERGYLTSCPLP